MAVLARGVGGGEANRWSDRAVPSRFSTQKFNFRCLKNILQAVILHLPIQQGNLEKRTAIFFTHEWFLGHFLNYQPKKGRNFQISAEFGQHKCTENWHVI